MADAVKKYFVKGHLHYVNKAVVGSKSRVILAGEMLPADATEAMIKNLLARGIIVDEETNEKTIAEKEKKAKAAAAALKR